MSKPDDETQTHVVLSIGTTVSHYRIIERIGAGGMGEVYRAEDTNLSRQVAIKVLPDLFGSDTERLARFEREAKLLAVMNHPNLATVYGFESVEGKRFLVMEMVEGETLAERIAKGPLPLDDALDVFHQIAAGMEAAHEKGIIHRDLKPANIKMTPDGKVKILDFGLAKALHGETVLSDLANSPTITENMTRAGVILGTAAYMSPEQAKGRPVDKRTDIWAFGCIVYECLTGKRAFEGETTSETLAAILRGEPDWDQLPRQTPAGIRSLLHHCFQKDVAHRLRDIGDASFETDDLLGQAAGLSVRRARPWRERIAWGIAVLSIAAVVILWLSSRGRQPADEEAVISQIPPPVDAVSCFRDGFALSPDGRKLAFISLSSKGERLVWLRSLDHQDAIPLAGTDDASYPFWSPDGKQIAFYAGGKLKKVASAGGPVQVICPASYYGSTGSSWGSAGIILFTNTWGSISAMSEEGGTPTNLPLKEPRSPFFLPDGRRFLYVDWSGTIPSAFIASLDAPGPGIEIVGTSGVAGVEWMPPDWLVMWRESDRTLITQRIDLAEGRRVGPQKVLAERVPSPNNWPLVSASPAGTLAFVVNPPEAGSDYASRLVWVDRKGTVIGYLGEVGGYFYLRISPDGRSVAVNPNDDVWIFNVATGMLTRLTNQEASGFTAYRPIWSPSGDYILAPDWEGGGTLMREYPVSGGGSRVICRGSSTTFYVTDWSPDGRYLASSLNNRQTMRWDLSYFDLSDSALKPFLATPADERDARFSPDGHWMAYMSNETGTFEVYVRSFPKGDQCRRVSYTGGRHPCWRADGKELFFLAPDWTLMAATVTSGPDIEIGTPAPLFQMIMADIGKGTTSPYDVSPDGQRFLVIQPQTKSVPLTLVQNWQALVDRK